jgi:hypothetical protein
LGQFLLSLSQISSYAGEIGFPHVIDSCQEVRPGGSCSRRSRRLGRGFTGP